MNEFIEEMDELIESIQDSWAFIRPSLLKKDISSKTEANFTLFANGVRDLNLLFHAIRGLVN